VRPRPYAPAGAPLDPQDALDRGPEFVVVVDEFVGLLHKRRENLVLVGSGDRRDNFGWRPALGVFRVVPYAASGLVRLSAQMARVLGLGSVWAARDHELFGAARGASCRARISSVFGR